MEQFVSSYPWVALALLIFGPAGGLWLVAKFRLNGLVKDHAEFLKQVQTDRASAQQWRCHVSDRMHAMEREMSVLTTKMEMVCPFWHGKTKEGEEHP